MEVGINVQGEILWKKLMHNYNKWGVEGGFFFVEGEIFKIGKRGPHVY
jgi:hypothetical protein